MWSFRGAPWFIDRQAARLGCTTMLAKAAYASKELYQTATLLSQLDTRIRKARRGPDGKPIFDYLERRQIEDALKTIEGRHCQLHMIAGAADAMLAEAYAELDMPVPRRKYEILAESDTPSMPALAAIPDNVVEGVVA